MLTDFNKCQKKTLVIGASQNPNRYSNIAIQRLIDNQHEVVAIGKKEGEVRGVKIFTSKKVVNDINTVMLYLNKKNQVEYYDYIVELKPKRVLFNPGTENEEFEKILVINNIAFERACTLVLLGIGAY